MTPRNRDIRGWPVGLINRLFETHATGRWYLTSRPEGIEKAVCNGVIMGGAG